MANREDLIVELSTNLSGAGAFTSDWFESAGILNLQALTSLSGGSVSVAIEESNDQTTSYPLNPFSFAGGGAFAPTARYFRLNISSGVASAAFRAVIRNVS